jgi:hypothetical protein
MQLCVASSTPTHNVVIFTAVQPVKHGQISKTTTHIRIACESELTYVMGYMPIQLYLICCMPVNREWFDTCVYIII